MAQSKLSASCFALLVRGLGTGREGRWGGRAIVARHVVYRFQTTTTSSVVFYRVIVFFCVCVCMGSGLSARVGAAHRHIVYCDGKPSILLVYVLSIFYGKILQFLLKACVLFVCLLVTMAGCGIVIILARRPCDTWFDTWTWKPFVRQRGEGGGGETLLDVFFSSCFASRVHLDIS